MLYDRHTLPIPRGKILHHDTPVITVKQSHGELLLSYAYDDGYLGGYASHPAYHDVAGVVSCFRDTYSFRHLTLIFSLATNDGRTCPLFPAAGIDIALAVRLSLTRTRT